MSQPGRADDVACRKHAAQRGLIPSVGLDVAAVGERGRRAARKQRLHANGHEAGRGRQYFLATILLHSDLHVSAMVLGGDDTGARANANPEFIE